MALRIDFNVQIINKLGLKIIYLVGFIFPIIILCIRKERSTRKKFLAEIIKQRFLPVVLVWQRVSSWRAGCGLVALLASANLRQLCIRRQMIHLMPIAQMAKRKLCASSVRFYVFRDSRKQALYVQFDGSKIISSAIFATSSLIINLEVKLVSSNMILHVSSCSGSDWRDYLISFFVKYPH